jgi:uncharacterized protein YjbI with pentapeptide repeats
MKKITRTTRTFTTVVAGATVLAVFGTGTAVAGGLITSAKIKNNTVKSIDVRDNNLKGVDVLDGSLTGADVQDGSLGGADVANDALSGAHVADGSLTNQDISVYYATVLDDGSVDRSSGGVTISKTGAGSYTVDFHRAVRDCAFTATIGNANDGSHNEGEADVSAQFLSLTAVHVYTRTAGTNIEADLPFMVTAVC